MHLPHSGGLLSPMLFQACVSVGASVCVPDARPCWPSTLGGLGTLTSTGSSFSSSSDMKAKVSAPCRADRS